MAKESKSQKTAKRNRLLYKMALVIVSTLVIVWFMPRSTSTKFYYEEGKPWRYGQLIAKSDFPIFKTEEEIKKVQDSITRKFQPYFNINKDILPEMRTYLYNNTAKEWKGNNANLYISHIASLLDTVYTRGIISLDEYDKLERNGNTNIRILDNNHAITKPVSHLFTTKSAYRYIINADTIKYSRLTMQSLNINELLEENLIPDFEKSSLELNSQLEYMDRATGIIQKEEEIIDRGEIATPEKIKILKSYERYINKDVSDKGKMKFTIIGQSIFVLFLMIVLVFYLTLFREDYFDKYRSGILLFGFPTLFIIVAFLMVHFQFLNIYMLPCCMVPIVIRVFLDSRTAFMFHTAMVIIISLTLRSPYEFIVLQLLTGMIAIQTLRELTQRSQVIHTAALITAFYFIFYSSYELILESSFEKVDKYMYMYFAINGVFLIFAYPLMWLIEKTLGFVSDVTLVELSNINHPLLQRMSETAPGTFQHSLQVSNLCAEVAKKIGARSQLVRTGALYHDIGKLERPVFFTENQKGVSPHKHLTPQKSAEVIIAHISNGLALAERSNLPYDIKRFIMSHHGTGITKYFYITYKNEHPDEQIDESLFRYPGPNPSTKEEAILMMADAVEAASRSLSEFTEESISKLVDKLVNTQIEEGHFSECDITFREIAVAKDVFKEKLKIVYHTRISYPELNRDNKEKDNKENEK